MVINAIEQEQVSNLVYGLAKIMNATIEIRADVGDDAEATEALRGLLQGALLEFAQGDRERLVTLCASFRRLFDLAPSDDVAAGRKRAAVVLELMRDGRLD